MQPFFLGCAVWSYKEWVGELFPAGSKSKDFLHLYSRRLTTVEGNTTFYAIPSSDTIKRWSTETPETFRFCLKIPREISHNGPLVNHIDATRMFIERVAPLDQRLGPFFLQLPPGYTATQIDDLAQWLQAWPTTYRLSVEVRHHEWYSSPNEPTLMNLLDQHNVGRVLMDVRPLRAGPLPGAEEDLEKARDRKPDVPLHPLYSSDIALIRYIGHPNLTLNEPFLDEWAKRLRAWMQSGIQIYYFMHCPDERQSPTLCRMLQQRLEQLIDVAPLPWNSLESTFEQPRLL